MSMFEKHKRRASVLKHNGGVISTNSPPQQRTVRFVNTMNPPSRNRAASRLGERFCSRTFVEGPDVGIDGGTENCSTQDLRRQHSVSNYQLNIPFEHKNFKFSLEKSFRGNDLINEASLQSFIENSFEQKARRNRNVLRNESYEPVYLFYQPYLNGASCV